jgi:hypothetical protein
MQKEKVMQARASLRRRPARCAMVLAAAIVPLSVVVVSPALSLRSRAVAASQRGPADIAFAFDAHEVSAWSYRRLRRLVVRVGHAGSAEVLEFNGELAARETRGRALLLLGGVLRTPGEHVKVTEAGSGRSERVHTGDGGWLVALGPSASSKVDVTFESPREGSETFRLDVRELLASGWTAYGDL